MPDSILVLVSTVWSHTDVGTWSIFNQESFAKLLQIMSGSTKVTWLAAKTAYRLVVNLGSTKSIKVNIQWVLQIEKYTGTSFASDGQQHSSGIPNVPVISSGWEGGSLVTTAELELWRLNFRATFPFHFRCSFCFGERLGSEMTIHTSQTHYYQQQKQHH